MRSTLLLGIAVVSIAGCSSPAPEDACVDLADTIASKANECGLDYPTSYEAAVRVFADGDCSEINAIPEEEAFYDECLPALKAVSCEQLNARGIEFPKSCSLASSKGP